MTIRQTKNIILKDRNLQYYKRARLRVLQFFYVNGIKSMLAFATVESKSYNDTIYASF